MHLRHPFPTLLSPTLGRLLMPHTHLLRPSILRSCTRFPASSMSRYSAPRCLARPRHWGGGGGVESQGRGMRGISAARRPSCDSPRPPLSPTTCMYSTTLCGRSKATTRPQLPKSSPSAPTCNGREVGGEEIAVGGNSGRKGRGSSGREGGWRGRNSGSGEQLSAPSAEGGWTGREATQLLYVGSLSQLPDA